MLLILGLSALAFAQRKEFTAVYRDYTTLVRVEGVEEACTSGNGPGQTRALLRAHGLRKNDDYRPIVLDALKRCGRGATPAVSALRRLASDRKDDRRLRLEALEVLGAIGTPSAAKALKPFLGASDDTIRLTALRSVGLVGPQAAALVPTVLPSLRHPSRSVVQAAVRALRRIGTTKHDRTVARALSPLLEHADPHVRGEALSTLATLAPTSPRLLDAARDYLRSDSIPKRLGALGTVAQLGPQASSLVEDVVSCPADEAPHVKRARGRAAQALDSPDLASPSSRLFRAALRCVDVESAIELVEAAGGWSDETARDLLLRSCGRLPRGLPRCGALVVAKTPRATQAQLLRAAATHSEQRVRWAFMAQVGSVRAFRQEGVKLLTTTALRSDETEATRKEALSGLYAAAFDDNKAAARELLRLGANRQVPAALRTEALSHLEGLSRTKATWTLSDSMWRALAGAMRSEDTELASAAVRIASHHDRAPTAFLLDALKHERSKGGAAAIIARRQTLADSALAPFLVSMARGERKYGATALLIEAIGRVRPTHEALDFLVARLHGDHGADVERSLRRLLPHGDTRPYLKKKLRSERLFPSTEDRLKALLKE